MYATMISSIGGLVASSYANKTRSMGYEMEAIKANNNTRLRKLIQHQSRALAKKNNLDLTMAYNQEAALRAVQGFKMPKRRLDKLNYDKEYNDYNASITQTKGQIDIMNSQLSESDARSASSLAKNDMSGLIQFGKSMSDLARIK